MARLRGGRGGRRGGQRRPGRPATAAQIAASSSSLAQINPNANAGPDPPSNLAIGHDSRLPGIERGTDPAPDLVKITGTGVGDDDPPDTSSPLSEAPSASSTSAEHSVLVVRTRPSTVIDNEGGAEKQLSVETSRKEKRHAGTRSVLAASSFLTPPDAAAGATAATAAGPSSHYRDVPIAGLAADIDVPPTHSPLTALSSPNSAVSAVSATSTTSGAEEAFLAMPSRPLLAAALQRYGAQLTFYALTVRSLLRTPAPADADADAETKMDVDEEGPSARLASGQSRTFREDTASIATTFNATGNSVDPGAALPRQYALRDPAERMLSRRALEGIPAASKPGQGPLKPQKVQKVSKINATSSRAIHMAAKSRRDYNIKSLKAHDIALREAALSTTRTESSERPLVYYARAPPLPLRADVDTNVNAHANTNANANAKVVDDMNDDDDWTCRFRAYLGSSLAPLRDATHELQSCLLRFDKDVVAAYTALVGADYPDHTDVSLDIPAAAHPTQMPTPMPMLIPMKATYPSKMTDAARASLATDLAAYLTTLVALTPLRELSQTLIRLQPHSSRLAATEFVQVVEEAKGWVEGLLE